MDIFNPGNLGNKLLKFPQSSSKVFVEQEQFPKFFKSIWGTGTVPQVPRNINYLGNMGTVSIVFLKGIWVTGRVPHIPQKHLGNSNSSPSS